MSIAADIRSYADTAVSQGKQVLSQAQARLAGVTGPPGGLYGKARENAVDIAGRAGSTVTVLRASAAKAINADAIKSAAEPYLAQAKDYGGTVTDRAQSLLAGVMSGERVPRLIGTAGTVTGIVVGTAHGLKERVVNPVRSLTGRAAAPPSTPPAAPTDRR